MQSYVCCYLQECSTKAQQSYNGSGHYPLSQQDLIEIEIIIRSPLNKDFNFRCLCWCFCQYYSQCPLVIILNQTSFLGAFMGPLVILKLIQATIWGGGQYFPWPLLSECLNIYVFLLLFLFYQCSTRGNLICRLLMQ